MLSPLLMSWAAGDKVMVPIAAVMARACGRAGGPPEEQGENGRALDGNGSHRAFRALRSAASKGTNWSVNVSDPIVDVCPKTAVMFWEC